MRTLKVGENAPHFTLLNQNNEAVSLTQFQGKKVLVYFYPKRSRRVVLRKPVAYEIAKQNWKTWAW